MIKNKTTTYYISGCRNCPLLKNHPREPECSHPYWEKMILLGEV